VSNSVHGVMYAHPSARARIRAASIQGGSLQLHNRPVAYDASELSHILGSVDSPM
jgi:hypothetical protein